LEVLEGRCLPTTVTTLADSGLGSLRDAIATTPAGGQVDFQPELTGTLTLTTGSLVINKSLTIAGLAAPKITITTNPAARAFTIMQGTNVVTISGLTITGKAPDSLNGSLSGIDNAGTLTLSSMAFSGNVNSTFNVGAMSLGGGIKNSGTLTVMSSTFSNNAASGRSGGSGGGIYNSGTLTVINSTFNGNSATDAFGGGAGGGIYNSGIVTVINSTLSGNSAGSTTGYGTINTGAGGGIFQASGSATLVNTLVAGNAAKSGPDVSATLTASSHHNLIGNNVGSLGLVDGQNGNRVGTPGKTLDPKLGPLQDNGGSTLTMALLPGSPALDAGDNAASPGPTDQRGRPRIVNNTIDIGAYEFQGTGLFALGGAPGRVQVFRISSGAQLADFAPFGSAYTGGVSVAMGDVNKDGFPDLVVAATTGNPHVKVYDGKALATGSFNPANPDASLLGQFFAYDLNFNVGATVAVGDVSGNGFADIITGATAGNPNVHVYSGKDLAMGTFNPSGASLLASFFPYALGFNVGVNVAVGDVNKDGFADIVTGPTAGNPDVRVYNGKDIAQGTFNPSGASQLAQFFAYGLNFNVGAFVAVADTTGGGFGDVITGATAGNPHVKVYSGQAIANSTFNNGNADASKLDEFFAYQLQFNVGTAVAAGDFEGIGKADILTGASRGAPHYRMVKGNATGIQPPALLEGFATGIQGGVAVGA
jgi:hypothetical protein